MSKEDFVVTLTYECTLGYWELWPDDDGPDNPTLSDVAELIREYGGPALAASDWNLTDSDTFSINGHDWAIIEANLNPPEKRKGVDSYAPVNRRGDD